ncbi:uncharacterized [Tachysurus ichikawai]
MERCTAANDKMPDRRVVFSSSHVCELSADTRLFEKLNLLMIFCSSHFAATLVKQLEGLIKSQTRKKGNKMEKK